MPDDRVYVVQSEGNVGITLQCPTPLANKLSFPCPVLPAIEPSGQCLDESVSLEVPSIGLDCVHNILLHKARCEG